MAVKKATATSTKTRSTKTVAPKGRLAKSTKETNSTEAGEMEVTIDRRRTPRREATEVVAPASMERRTKVQRRRQIDPTTCERDYSDEEVGFMNAMDEYKRTSGRMFPTCSEVLEVIRGLGYVKLTPAELAVIRPEALNPVESGEFVSDEEQEDSELEFETL